MTEFKSLPGVRQSPGRSIQLCVALAAGAALLALSLPHAIADLRDRFTEDPNTCTVGELRIQKQAFGEPLPRLLAIGVEVPEEVEVNTGFYVIVRGSLPRGSPVSFESFESFESDGVFQLDIPGAAISPEGVTHATLPGCAVWSVFPQREGLLRGAVRFYKFNVMAFGAERRIEAMADYSPEPWFYPIAIRVRASPWNYILVVLGLASTLVPIIQFIRSFSGTDGAAPSDAPDSKLIVPTSVAEERERHQSLWERLFGR